MNKKIFFILSLLLIFVFLSGCGSGGGGGSLSAPPGTNPGVPSVIKLLDVQNVAQIGSTVYLKAKVLDGNGNPVSNQPVSFTQLSGVGTLSAAIANTDGNGTATVTLNSALPGFSTVLAAVSAGAGQVRDRRTVYFTPNIKFEGSLSLDVDSVPGDGVYNQPSDFILFEPAASDDTFEVLATVFDITGFPVGGGWSVFWQADHAEAVFVRTDTITDLNGQARAIVQVIPSSIRDTETTLNIGASAGNGAFNMVTLFLKPVTVNSVVVRATPTVVASDGTSTISAIVTTNTGDPVPDGTTVNFTSTAGVLSAPFAQTASGVATTDLTVPTVTSDTNITVNASVGGKSGSTSVNVTTAPIAPACTASAPTVSIAPSTRTVAASGSVTYTVTVTNNDTGTGCTNTTFALTKTDTPVTPTANFATSTLSATTPSPCALAPLASCTAIVTHTATATPTIGQTLATSVTATATGHAAVTSTSGTTTIGP